MTAAPRRVAAHRERPVPERLPNAALAARPVLRGSCSAAPGGGFPLAPVVEAPAAAGPALPVPAALPGYGHPATATRSRPRTSPRPPAPSPDGAG
ncbi:hypothetical protein ACFXGT_30930, partial [Streptomyces sp. NPDC059352]